MSTPKRSDAYPEPMHSALLRALEKGELFIPCPGKISPAALRLQFYGLTGALRREGKNELVDPLGFYLQADPLGLRICLRDLGSFGALVSEALAPSPGETPPSPANDLESAFDRIMKGEKL